MDEIRFRTFTLEPRWTWYFTPGKRDRVHEQVRRDAAMFINEELRKDQFVAISEQVPSDSNGMGLSVTVWFRTMADAP